MSQLERFDWDADAEWLVLADGERVRVEKGMILWGRWIYPDDEDEGVLSFTSAGWEH